MADVSYAINLNVAAGALQQNVNANVTANFQTAGLVAVTLDLGTSTQAISTASLSNVGLAYARSLVVSTNQTATVSFGRLSGTTLFDVVRLKPGDAALLRLAPGNYGARAAAAGSRLLVQIFED